MQEHSSAVNQLYGVLTRAHIKLGAVATDIMGVSGRAMLAALIAGRADPETMAELAKGRVRTGLTQIGHAAARTKGTYLSALHQRLAARRGKQRAVMAAPMPSSSAPSIGSLAMNRLVSWGPTAVMHTGATTSSTA